MSRVTHMDIDDTWSLLAAGRWEKNTRATLKSARGQKVLREIEAALVAMPVHELVTDLLWVEPNEMGRDIADAWGVTKEPQVCVLGAYARYKGRPYEEWEWLNAENANESARWAEDKLGMAFTLAWNLMDLNDEDYRNATPQQRYDGILRWVRKHMVGEG